MPMPMHVGTRRWNAAAIAFAVSILHGYSVALPEQGTPFTKSFSEQFDVDAMLPVGQLTGYSRQWFPTSVSSSAPEFWYQGRHVAASGKVVSRSFLDSLSIIFEYESGPYACSSFFGERPVTVQMTYQADVPYVVGTQPMLQTLDIADQAFVGSADRPGFMGRCILEGVDSGFLFDVVVPAGGLSTDALPPGFVSDPADRAWGFSVGFQFFADDVGPDDWSGEFDATYFLNMTENLIIDDSRLARTRSAYESAESSLGSILTLIDTIGDITNSIGVARAGNKIRNGVPLTSGDRRELIDAIDRSENTAAEQARIDALFRSDDYVSELDILLQSIVADPIKSLAGTGPVEVFVGASVQGYGEFINDPPRFDFNVVTTPDYPEIPAGFDAAVPNGLADVAEAAVRRAVQLNALVLATERYQGASLFGDTVAAALQSDVVSQVLADMIVDDDAFDVATAVAFDLSANSELPSFGLDEQTEYNDARADFDSWAPLLAADIASNSPFSESVVLAVITDRMALTSAEVLAELQTVQPIKIPTPAAAQDATKEADANGDRIVNQDDVRFVIEMIGQSSPLAEYAAPATSQDFFDLLAFLRLYDVTE